jgi:hypothetical protein
MIPISLILDKVKLFIGDGNLYLYRLISDFLNIPIYDDFGNRRFDVSLPPIGELTRVIFNIVLIDVFDREFTKRFPGIKIYRFVNEVFISTRENDQVTFGVDALYKLLNDLQLVGTIHSIGPGDDCHIIYNRRVVLVDNTGKVVVL